MSKGCYYGVNNISRQYRFTDDIQVRNTSMSSYNTIHNSYKKEKLYYIIREDGSSIFELPYREEFVYHCLIKLFDTAENQKFRLLQFADNMLIFNYIPITSKADLILLKN